MPTGGDNMQLEVILGFVDRCNVVHWFGDKNLKVFNER